MIKIIQSYLIDKKRPKNIYHYKFTEIIKDDNPNIVSVKYHHAWKGIIKITTYYIVFFENIF